MAKSLLETVRARGRVQSVPEGETRTKQSFKDTTDINRIMSSYKRTGLVSHVSPGGARYEDLPDAFDFHEAASRVVLANQAFQALPARLRDRFGNEPGPLLAFLQDVKNRDEAIALGLIERPVSPVADPVPEAPLAKPRPSKDA